MAPNGQFLAFSWMRKYGPVPPARVDMNKMIVSASVAHHDGGEVDCARRRRDGPCC